MASIDYAFLAEHVRAEGGMSSALGIGMDTLQVPGVPAGANMGLVSRVSFARTECGRPHRVEMIVQDVDGIRLFELASVVEPEWREDLPVHWKLGMAWVMNFGVVLPAYGLYSVDLLLNDTVGATLNFRVIEMPR